jgi:tetratricopeptide (TPR) repeat protein
MVMMSRIALIVVVSIVIASCVSSQKMLQRGQYDRAIDKAAEKLQKRPNNAKQLRVLEEAFELANMFDEERIQFLEREGLEQSWVEIYELYEQLDRRQNRVRRLPAQVRSRFVFQNYDDQIITAKAEAANVSYNRGLEYLERGDRISARQAWQEFERARNIFPGYRNVDIRLAEALEQGTNHALFVIENNSGMILPEGFDAEMRKITLKDLNTRWLNFDTFENENTRYDHFIVLNIKEIAVSPETIDRRTFTESREIQDGMRYKLDERGNVQKDSLGNDIRVPNMVTVSAEITEAVQHKAAIVAGSLDFYELNTDQLIKTDNISVEAVFTHSSASYSGDSRALSDENRRIVTRNPVPFPPTEALLIDATSLLKAQSRTIVSRNRRMLEN